MSIKKLFISKNVYLEDTIEPAAILVENGKIIQVLKQQKLEDSVGEPHLQIIDVGNLHIFPGVIDSHVHINEPGRTEWEGYLNATQAAAAGGITTLVDMPLNSIPATTTLNNLEIKLKTAQDKVYVDVAFWGGVIPGNEQELLKLVKAGVVGFKCFLCPSGVDEFPYVHIEDVEKALKILENTDVVLAFHAEIEENLPLSGDPTKYDTFLKTRPESMEVKAIREIVALCNKYKTKCHIVHLSAASGLPLIEQLKKSRHNLTVETCHHYLTLSSENVPDKATQYKCCPPIRDSDNQEKLWNALSQNILDMVVSDHSPCTPDLKLIDTSDENNGNFLKAWGGIASLQFEEKKRYFNDGNYFIRPQ